MNKLAVTALAAGCVALGAVGRVALRSGRHLVEVSESGASNRATESETSPSPAGPLVLALRARIAILEARLADREGACNRPPAWRNEPSAGASRESTDDDTADAQPLLSPRASGATTPAPRVATGTLADTIASEPPDPDWSPSAERALRSLAAALQPAAALESVHCGQRLCRLEIRHPVDNDPSARLVSLLEGMTTFSMQRMTQPAAAGTGTIVILARAGAEIPLITTGGDDDDHSVQ